MTYSIFAMKKKRVTVDQKLSSLINNEKLTDDVFRDYTQDNIIKLLDHYNNPHRHLKAIHIAGTNGKGSVAYMCAAILQSSGYKTGLYTSPHLLNVNERITINGFEIEETTLMKYIDDLESASKITGTTPTYFDALTIIAFRYFYDQKTDIAILETGLGGTMDSTNVIQPIVSLITIISKDHTRLLGNTITSIAENKAGIIKPGVPILTSNTHPTVKAILLRKAASSDAPIYLYKNDFYYRKKVKDENGMQVADIYFRGHRIEKVRVNADGQFQLLNASHAVAGCLVLREMGFSISDTTVKTALSNLKIPGRLEKLRTHPIVIFDPAHNTHAIRHLTSTIARKYPDKTCIYIVSLMRDKDVLSIMKSISKQSGSVIYYNLADPRGLKVSNSNKYEYRIKDLKVADNINDLFNYTENIVTEKKVIVFTGSFRLYATALSFVSRICMK